MSSYCGVVHRRGAPISPAELTAMSVCLTRHAPDTTGRWHEGAAGFFHALRFTTPESLHECLPYHDGANDLVITADARIDNRGDLGDELALSATELQKLSDSEVLLKGYLRWGENLPEHLLGDFTFAVWDVRRRRLFCARDHFGVRPFYYTTIGDEFIFATDPKALLDHPRVLKRLNLDRWLGAVSLVDPSPTATFYDGIHRLAPGTWLRFDEHGLVERRYWALDPEKELAPRTSDEFAQEFRTIFMEAVRCRLRSAYPIGAHLSGGLDSSAVTCVAREVLRQEQRSAQLPLRTFSNIVQAVKNCDESKYIAEVVAGGDLAPAYTRPDRAGVFFAYDEFVQDEHDFIFVANLNLLEHLGAATHAAGVRVCLDGFDGDTTIGHGGERFTDLAQAGDWAAFSQEARLLATLHPEVQTTAIFNQYALPVLDELSAAHRWGRYLKSWLALQRHYDRNVRGPLRRHFLKTFSPAPLYSLWRSLRRKSAQREARTDAGKEFSFFDDPVAGALRSYKAAHLKPPATASCAVRASQCEKLHSGLFSHALEVAGRLHARYGVEARHPFLDKRLVEFCVALPAEQKLRAGYTRHIMREGLRGILPEMIRLRVDKTDYTAAHVGGIIRFDAARMVALIDDLFKGDDPVVNVGALRRYLEGLLKTKRTKEKEFLNFWHSLMSTVWMQGAGFKLPRPSPAPVDAQKIFSQK